MKTLKIRVEATRKVALKVHEWMTHFMDEHDEIEKIEIYHLRMRRGSWASRPIVHYNPRIQR